MIRLDELAKAAAGYMWRMQQTFRNFGRMLEDRKVAETALRETVDQLSHAEQELRLTLDSIPTLVWHTRADGFAEYLNKRWLDYTGLSLDQALGWEWQVAVHPDDRPRFIAAWREILASEKPLAGTERLRRSEARLRRFDGVYRWFLFRPMPLRDESGKVIRWYGTSTDIEYQKRAESALQRSETYLAEAQKLSHTGSFGWNVSKGEIFWSEETFRIFEYEPGTNVTTHIVLNRVHPDDRALVQRVIDRAATHKEAFDVEHRLQMPDGSVKHLHLVARALVDEPGNLQFAGAVMDITPRKETEQALRQSEKRYQNMFQAMAVSLLELDYSRARETLRTLYKSGIVDLEPYLRDNKEATRQLLREIRVLDVNDQMVALFGRDNKQELLQTVELYWPEESWGDFITAVMASFGGDKFSGETRLRTLDGTIFDAHISMWFASEDRARGLVGVVDTTARRQAFTKLEASERRYRYLFQSTPVALWRLNAKSYITMFQQLRAEGVEDLGAYLDDHPEFLSKALSSLIVEEVNEHAVQMFGARDANELLDYPTHWLWRESIDTLRRSMESLWRGEDSFQETTKLVTSDGRVIDVLYTVARPRLIEGITLVSMIDLTERVRAQEELRRIQADFAHAARVSMLGELTASIAHEVNQPLASIAATSHASMRWLAQPAPNVEKLRKLTSDVISDVERASDIIGRIRAMVVGRPPEQTLLSLDEVIQEALLFLRHEVQSRGVAVSHIPALGAQKVSGDRTQLQQVIVNLAVNAVQAMAQAHSAKRNISIRTVAHDRSKLRCLVEDSGPGIEPDNITRLFDSFFTTKDSGMGMGLRICRSIIEAHGGHLIADNDSAEGGARFSFTLPIAH